MSHTAETLSKFIADAPPGELDNVLQDVRSIVEDSHQYVQGMEKDIAQYYIDHFHVVSVSGKKVIISKFNQLRDDTFFDAITGVEFKYDFSTQKVTSTHPYNDDISSETKTLDENLGRYVNEHFPSQAGYGVFPQKDGTLALLVVDNKYSPQNYWNGSWKSYYVYDPSTDSINGEISVDVHYFEEGNVRLKTSKPVSIASSRDVIKDIKAQENAYQDELNRTFVGLNEGQFKALRRQLPVTRSKMTWGKAVGNYRLGKDIGGETTNQ